MRPPLKKRIEAQTVPATTDSRTEALQEKAALAKHLHEQGVNPVLWTKAHPAPQSEQVTFQKTGIKPRGNQFEVAGKLYNWSDEVKATPAQARAIGDAYVAERTGKDDAVAVVPKIEELVDIDAVPLKHPFGTPHTERPANDMSVADERAALIKHYAQYGVDPDKAHLGDPVNMKDQERLKAQIEKVLPGDKSEISGLPGFYQGFDDGMIYSANEFTRPSEVVQQNGTEHAAANENYGDSNGVTNEDVKHDDNTQNKQQTPKVDRAISNYSAAVDNLPEIIAFLDARQAGEPLTERQARMELFFKGVLRKAGIKYDYTLSDPDALRDIYKQAKAELSGIQKGSGDSSELAMALLTMQATQAIAGGPFDDVRIMQSESLADTFLLATQKYLPVARKVIGPLITADNVEKAKDGPIDYQAALHEMGDLLSDIGIIDREDDAATVPEVSEAAPGNAQKIMNASTFIDRLPTFDEVTIQIGDFVIKQHPLTTATDQIFLEEFVDVASSMGCEPDPEPTREDDEKKAIHGGNDAQRRITDMDQPGHNGSGQPDGDLTMSGNGNKGAAFFNSVSTHSDGLRLLAREIAAAQNILRVMIKQAGMDDDIVRTLANPVRTPGPLFIYRKKWGWTLDKIRKDLRSKIRKAFDQYYQDCLPKGPPEIIDLDGVGE